MLGDSAAVVVAVALTRLRAMPLSVITMRKSTQGFPFLFYMGFWLRSSRTRADSFFVPAVLFKR